MASPLDQFVVTARGLANKGACMDAHEILSKSHDLLMKNVQHLDGVMEKLSYTQTYGKLAILRAKFNLPPQTAPNFQDIRMMQTEQLLGDYEKDQVKSVPEYFAEVCHGYTADLIDQNIPMKGVPILLKALTKFQLNNTQLTSVHADICQLCLLAKCFKPALALLDIDISGILMEVKAPPNVTNVYFDAKYYLLYYYYGGMIYLAVRNLDRALYFFEVAITTPARAFSHIMLEAYKKYILVCLLLYGKFQPIPKYTSQVVNRFIKPLSQPYHDLANAFTMDSNANLNTVVNKHADVYTRDHNMGLVKQVASVLYKKNIQRLTKTFLTLSLSDVASRVGLPSPTDAETYILHMIEDKEIYATINQKDGMVVFLDEPDKYSGPEVLKHLEDQVTLCMELDKKVLTMDEDVQVNPNYVKKSTGIQDEEQQSKSAYAM